MVIRSRGDILRIVWVDTDYIKLYTAAEQLRFRHEGRSPECRKPPRVYGKKVSRSLKLGRSCWMVSLYDITPPLGEEGGGIRLYTDPSLLIDWGIQSIHGIHSEMSVTNYALRMDYNSAMLDRLKTYMDSLQGRYFVVYETAEGENPHIHAFMTSSKTLQALRVQLKRLFPECVGNKAYSLKECDDKYEDYYLYMCKGDGDGEMPVVLAKHGLDFTDEKISEYHSRYWVSNAQILESKRKRSSFAGTIVEQLEKICKDKGVRSKDEIAREYIRLYRDQRRPINVFQARATVNTVCLLVSPDSNEEDILVGAICNN